LFSEHFAIIIAINSKLKTKLAFSAMPKQNGQQIFICNKKKLAEKKKLWQISYGKLIDAQF